MNRDDIIRMGYAVAGPNKWWQDDSDLEEFAALVAAHEREVCAWIAGSYGGPKEPMLVGTYEAGWHNAAEAIAADIRARGEV